MPELLGPDLSQLRGHLQSTWMSCRRWIYKTGDGLPSCVWGGAAQIHPLLPKPHDPWGVSLFKQTMNTLPKRLLTKTKPALETGWKSRSISKAHSFNHLTIMTYSDNDFSSTLACGQPAGAHALAELAEAALGQMGMSGETGCYGGPAAPSLLHVDSGDSGAGSQLLWAHRERLPLAPPLPLRSTSHLCSLLLQTWASSAYTPGCSHSTLHPLQAVSVRPTAALSLSVPWNLNFSTQPLYPSNATTAVDGSQGYMRPSRKKVWNKDRGE